MSHNHTQEEVDEALRDIDTLIDRIGDQVTRNVNEETDDGIPIRGREVQHGGHNYHVLASTQFPHVKIQAGFDAAESLAANQAIAQAQGPQVQVTDAALQSAQTTLRERAEGSLGDIRQGLINRTSVNEMVVHLNAGDVFVTGFQIETRLFVYDEEISVSEFNDEVQSVINVVWRGQDYLVNQYDLRGALDEGGDELRGFA